MPKVRFLSAGQYGTPHRDESPFDYEAGEIVDLAKITRSPDWLAARLVKLGRAVLVVEELETSPVPEKETKPADDSAKEVKPAAPAPERRKKRQERLLD